MRARSINLAMIFLWTILMSSCANSDISDQKSNPENVSHHEEGVAKSDNLSHQISAHEKNDEIPHYVLEILTYIRTHDRAPKHYVGGRIFYNREKRLPLKDNSGSKMNYKEWDVHPKNKGENRGPERLITSDFKAYYTKDHYKTFILIQETH